MVDSFTVQPKRGDAYKTTDILRSFASVLANGIVPGIGNQFNIIDQVSPALDIKIDTGRCILDGINVELTALSDAKSLTDASTNHIFLELDINAGGRVTGASITINTTGTEPTDPFIKIGEVVTSGGDITAINEVKLGIGWLDQIGEIRAFGVTNANIPLGWLRCDDAAIGRTLYKRLFDKIGTSFGTGDGSTTFNIPLLNGKYPRGATGVADPGTEVGEDTHVLLTAELPAHSHAITPNPHTHGIPKGTSSGFGIEPPQGSATGSGVSNVVSTSLTSASIGSDTAHENKPASQEVIYCIKV